MPLIYAAQVHECDHRRWLADEGVGSVWECGHCGRWWRKDPDAYTELGRVGRWRTARKVRREEAERGQL